ncbi:F0F1 ATP synthase subunit B [Blattabacterium cuenoti]|uniref:F0F1 ATP synthase subunit B n=1 Tax=Blattabacterium cuenoti TaxID=1653831 RepID=UPI00163CB855|nr:F0F1 ATP synthase subunit B [Blattabacterium cuenoti]
MDLVTPSVGLIFWHTIIFVTLMLFLSKFAWKPIINFIDQREKKIQISIEKADIIKKELIDVENKKKKILKEIHMKRDIILKEALQIKEKIKIKAKKEGLIEKKKIIEETIKSIKIEKEAVLNELKNKIGGISVKIAEKILIKELNQTNKQDEFIKELVDKFY